MHYLCVTKAKNMTLTKGTKLEVTKSTKIFIGTIEAIFEDYYVVRNRRGGINYVYEGEYKVL